MLETCDEVAKDAFGAVRLGRCATETVLGMSMRERLARVVTSLHFRGSACRAPVVEMRARQ